LKHDIRSCRRAINFYFYPTSKAYLAKQFPNAPTEKPGQTAEDSPLIHLSAAVVAGERVPCRKARRRKHRRIG
jgi:hypothetical protein